MADQRAYRLVARKNGRTVLDRLLVADGYWSRFVGLQFRRPLPNDSGLLLVPCPAIHTCFVRFPLDLIWLDRTDESSNCAETFLRGEPPEDRKARLPWWKPLATRRWSNEVNR